MESCREERARGASITVYKVEYKQKAGARQQDQRHGNDHLATPDGVVRDGNLAVGGEVDLSNMTVCGQLAEGKATGILMTPRK